MRLFVSDDGKSGFAIKSDGDIVSVFSGGGGAAMDLVSLAIEQGGTKLDCFDTVLPEIYSVNGITHHSILALTTLGNDHDQVLVKTLPRSS